MLSSKISPPLPVVAPVAVGVGERMTSAEKKCPEVAVPETRNAVGEMSAKQCREEVFVTKGQGGVGTFNPSQVDVFCAIPLVFDVCKDLELFTGLTKEELSTRLQRIGNFHFEGEHLFWNPKTGTELAWYYSTSQSYLFANAVHKPDKSLARLTKEHEPILDYSGGVGNNVLYLAGTKGFKCQYFGIGMIEKEFAQFRFNKRGLQDLVTIRSPWSEATKWMFDPITGALPRDSSLGAILAFDVLEHIPQYHVVVEAMVASLKVGGVILERSPFAVSLAAGTVDTRVHLGSGGVSMAEAMGDKMTFVKEEKWWVKIKE